jgi:hypothetical protein
MENTVMMKCKCIPALALAFGVLTSASAYSETLTGKIVYKSAEDSLIVKTGSLEFDMADVAKMKLVLEGQAEQVAKKARVKTFETEERTIVVAAFRDIRNLPEDSSLIIKANILEGNNGKLLYGDVYTRACEKGLASELSDQDTALERLLYGIRERRGCDLKYRGGILLTTVESASQS